MLGGGAALKNNFEIVGDDVLIFLDKKGGEQIATTISIEDLERALGYPGKWVPSFKKGAGVHYVTGFRFTEDRRKSSIQFHRYLTNCPKGLVVDHINHDTLDNRRKNLRIVTHAQNIQNRSLSRNNSSGVRGVSYCKARGLWEVKFRVNYTTKHFGRYPTLEEASLVAAEALREALPYSDPQEGVNEYDAS
ncbi:HNH endonuclease [Paenibacillus sp. FSL L8-0436]|uniref:HNH endonuclease n=1 Tax=Paenibacillus sp. FSL L8-0436 TaxID=2954686 RepID=UPI0031581E59